MFILLKRMNFFLSIPKNTTEAWVSVSGAWPGDMSGQTLQPLGLPTELLAVAHRASASRAKKRLMKLSHGLVRSPAGRALKERTGEGRVTLSRRAQPEAPGIQLAARTCSLQQRWKLGPVGGAMKLHLENVRLVSLEER